MATREVTKLISSGVEREVAIRLVNRIPYDQWKPRPTNRLFQGIYESVGRGIGLNVDVETETTTILHSWSDRPVLEMIVDALAKRLESDLNTKARFTIHPVIFDMYEMSRSYIQRFGPRLAWPT